MHNAADAEELQRQDFGRWLAEQREAIGYTQDQLAERVGVHRTTLARIETGVVGTKPAKLYALADALGLDRADVLRHYGRIPPDAADNAELRNLGDRIKTARVRQGMTQAEMAQALGVKPSRLGNWEQGLNDVPTSLLTRIALLTRTDPGWLLTGVQVGRPQPGVPPQPGAEDPEALLLRALDAVRRRAG